MFNEKIDTVRDKTPVNSECLIAKDVATYNMPVCLWNALRPRVPEIELQIFWKKAFEV